VAIVDALWEVIGSGWFEGHVGLGCRARSLLEHSLHFGGRMASCGVWLRKLFLQNSFQIGDGSEAPFPAQSAIIALDNSFIFFTPTTLTPTKPITLYDIIN